MVPQSKRAGPDPHDTERGSPRYIAEVKKWYAYHEIIFSNNYTYIQLSLIY